MPIVIIRGQLLLWSRVEIIFLEGIQSSLGMVSTQLLLKKIHILVPRLLDWERKLFISCFVSRHAFHKHRLFCFLYRSLVHKSENYTLLNCLLIYWYICLCQGEVLFIYLCTSNAYSSKPKTDEENSEIQKFLMSNTKVAADESHGKQFFFHRKKRLLVIYCTYYTLTLFTWIGWNAK